MHEDTETIAVTSKHEGKATFISQHVGIVCRILLVSFYSFLYVEVCPNMSTPSIIILQHFMSLCYFNECLRSNTIN